MAALWLLTLFPYFVPLLAYNSVGSLASMMADTGSADSQSLRGATTGTADTFSQSRLHSTDRGELNLIPQPQSVTKTGGLLHLRTGDVWNIDAPSPDLAEAVRSHVLARAGIAENESGNSAGKTVRLSLTDEGSNGNPEGYRLGVSDTGVEIDASTNHGLFNGVMTLRQLLQPSDPSRGNQAVSLLQQKPNEWTVPHVEIEDAPTFSYRGLMLDVSRHFFGPDHVRKLIDTMALYKMTALQLHLTDDQGWRLEVEKFPSLVEVGSVRASTQIDHEANHQDGKRYGGYFSKQDVRDIVRYAQKHYIDVIPEIDLPGHAQAALAAYPDLGNVDVAAKPDVSSTFGVGPYTFAPNAKVTSFLETVLDEAMDVMPSNLVHLGGDEVSTDQYSRSGKAQSFMQQHGMSDVRKIQGYFNNELAAHVAAKGRKTVLWDEALTTGNAPPGSVIMVWNPGNSEAVAKRAAREGHEVILAPWGYTYFDQAQGNHGEPMGQGGVVELSHTYSMPIGDFGSPEPMGKAAPVKLNASALLEKQQDLSAGGILGGQGQLWSEYFPNWNRVEYMAWPRGMALAEVLWTGAARPTFADFRRRLGPRLEELAELGVGFRDPETHDEV